MNPIAIETQNLCKRFGRKHVIRDITLQIPHGSVVGCLGPNAAGKTTLMRMLMGHLHPSSGTMKTLGMDPWRRDREARQRVAYVSQSMKLPGWMTAGQAIAAGTRLFPRWDHRLADELLDEFALRGSGKFCHLSIGQQRKLMILLAMAQSSDLLLLDEPAAGLDIESRNMFLNRIVDLACEGGRTVFLSSHLLSDLERMIDRIVMIREGRLVLHGDLLDMKSRVRKLVILQDIAPAVIQEHFDCIDIQQPSLSETIVTVRDFDEGRLRALSGRLESPEHVKVESFNLEQLYMELIATDGNDSAAETEPAVPQPEGEALTS